MKTIGKRPTEEMTIQGDCIFGPNIKPIASVSPGEVIEIETHDCFADIVRPERGLKQVLESGQKIFENPVTGPIYIETAQPGDTLVVNVLDIEVGDRGVTALVPGIGALEGWFAPVPSLSKFTDIRGGNVIFSTSIGKSIKIPVKPVIGTIGVAPATESVATVTPSRHGGNLDTPYLTVGSRLYLPVNVKGALFALGDVHAVQGEGEVCGTAVEVPAIVRVKLDVLQGITIEWPRIESSEEIMTVCSLCPLEDAARLAVRELIGWLVADFGLEKYEAYMLLSVAGDVEISQIVNPKYTVVAKIQKDLLSQLK